MHVANDVEGTMLVALVVPKRLALDGDGFNLLRRRKLVHVTKAFALQPPQ